MHLTNKMYWDHCSAKYSKYFNDPSRVIEFGSYNINGSIRGTFECEEYVGVDWRPGPLVDVVSLAHEYDSDEAFDTVVSASMLEHDPYWEKSIPNMLDHLTEDGILILTWGAALNVEHCLEEAPDGEFHPLQVGRVMDLLDQHGMYIHEVQYEQIFMEGHVDISKYRRRDRGGMGEVGLVAFRDEEHAIGERVVNELLDEDK